MLTKSDSPSKSCLPKSDSKYIPPTRFLPLSLILISSLNSDTAAALNSWSAINSANIAVVADSVPVSSALPNSLRFSVPSGRTGGVGFANAGFFGIKVTANTAYRASFFFRFPSASSFRGSLTVGLRTSGGQTLASSPVTISGAQTTWRQVNVTLTPRTTPSNATANQFFVTVDGAAASGQTINFAMFSLFPPTFNNRPNGLRADIVNALAEMKPSFFRLPGGNNLVRRSLSSNYPHSWMLICAFSTIGGLVLGKSSVQSGTDHLPTPGSNGAHSMAMECDTWPTSQSPRPRRRLGLRQYRRTWLIGVPRVLRGFEDGADYGGLGRVCSWGHENQLQPYIQQAIDQINFVIGDPARSAAGALRASLGHPAPFNLKYIEVGNEDFFAADTYPYRWHDFVTALSAQFPNLKFIATTNTFNPILSPNPLQYDNRGSGTDNLRSAWFAQNSFFYDDFQRNGTTYFEGEYAAISTNPNDIFGSPADGRLVFPTMQSSSGEAAFMTGLERNSDIVFAASYAPLLNHVANSQWTPNLVSFDSAAVYRSTSFYAQKLFSVNRGDQYIPSTLPARTGTLFWSVVRNTPTGEIIIKVSNTVAAAADLTFVLPFGSVATSGTAQVLTGAATTSNTPTTPNAAVPSTHTITTGKTLNYTAPGFSVSVLTFKAS
ncbi:hypothetical protein HGRIS_000452 [Hohenbuehelia grisea]|uniref:non-reducing end alpha-L-arabinofuranosidase n=1 Tax=Hohenbuehelia grisea TaxID=104357 RepID=A0ABR3JT46_9AGAR